MTTAIDIQELLVWGMQHHATIGKVTPPDDARRVHDAVMALPTPLNEIVARYARHGTTPDWQPSIRATGDLEATRRLRQHYSHWVQGLFLARTALEGRLAGFAVTGPAADESPWRDRSVAGAIRSS